MPTVVQVSAAETAEYSRVFHHTSYDDALAILEERCVKGGDTHKHANFFASAKFKNKIAGVPRSNQVCLEFKWPGNQAVLDSWPNDGEPRNSSIAQPILFHIVTQDPKDWNSWTIAERGYWQSVMYPGSNGLIFEGLTFSAARVVVKKPSLLRRWGFVKKTEFAEQQEIDQRKRESINQWAKKQRGQCFQVSI